VIVKTIAKRNALNALANAKKIFNPCKELMENIFAITVYILDCKTKLE